MSRINVSMTRCVVFFDILLLSAHVWAAPSQPPDPYYYPYLVADIYPGMNFTPLVPHELTAMGNLLYFAADQEGSGLELWKSNGTTSGTLMVKDIDAGSTSSNPTCLTSVNDTLFFAAETKASGRELWKSDGTAAGTVLVKDIIPGPGSSYPKNLTNVNGTLFFMADNGNNGYELWKSNGTAAGTVLVKDIAPYSESSNPQNLTNVNGTLYFTADDGLITGRELWKSNGTSAGTVLVKNIMQGYWSSNPNNLTNVNGTLFFVADAGGDTGKELWKSNGTSSGTVLVKDIHTSAGYSSDPQYLVNMNGTLYFSAVDGTHGQSLWKSNGTAAGTVLVKDTSPLPLCPMNLTLVNGLLYFSGVGLDKERLLWMSDGTTAGTDVVIEPVGGFDFNPENLTDVNGTLCFTANDSLGRELWKSDGTPLGTVRIKDIRPGSESSTPQTLTNVKGTLFFTAEDGTTGRELWAYVAVGQKPVIKTIPNASTYDTRAYTGPLPVLTTGSPGITWSLITKPANMTISTTTGLVSWPKPTTTGSPFTITIRATNKWGSGDASWKLTVIHPIPSKPGGKLKVTYHVESVSTSPDGQTVKYTYLWTSDKGDKVTHGPTTSTSDTLTEMNLVQDGEVWTVTVTPSAGTITGLPATAKVKFVDIHNSVWIWSLYR